MLDYDSYHPNTERLQQLSNLRH